MNITLEEKKLKAIELMTKLDIYKPYIKGFKEENEVYYFEEFAGFWAFQEPELVKKIKEIEQKHNCLVYAVTHEFTEFGECYDLLLVSDYKEEWDYELEKISPNTYSAFAYVWNKDDEWCSEFGSIGIQSFGGGVKRCC